MRQVCNDVAIFLNRSAHFIADKSKAIADHKIEGKEAYVASQQITDLNYARTSVRCSNGQWTDENRKFVIDFYTTHLKLTEYSSENVPEFSDSEEQPKVCTDNISVCEVIDLIPERFTDLKDTPNSLVGNAFSVPMVSEDERWLRFTPIQITRELPWDHLLNLDAAGLVKAWDRFIVTDKRNYPIFIVNKSLDGKSWYNTISNEGVVVLRYLNDGFVPTVTPTMVKVIWNGDNSTTILFDNNEFYEVEVTVKIDTEKRVISNALSPLVIDTPQTYVEQVVQAQVRGIRPDFTEYSIWMKDTIDKLEMMAPTNVEAYTEEVNSLVKYTCSWHEVSSASKYKLYFNIDGVDSIEETTGISYVKMFDKVLNSNEVVKLRVSAVESGGVESEKTEENVLSLPTAEEVSIVSATWSDDKITVTTELGDYTELELSYSVSEATEVIIENADLVQEIDIPATDVPQPVVVKARGSNPKYGLYTSVNVDVPGIESVSVVSATWRKPDHLDTVVNLSEYTEFSYAVEQDDVLLDSGLSTSETNDFTVPRKKDDSQVKITVAGSKPTVDDTPSVFNTIIKGVVMPSELEQVRNSDDTKVTLSWNGNLEAEEGFVSYTVVYRISDETIDRAYTGTAATLDVDLSDHQSVTWKVKTNFDYLDSNFVTGPESKPECNNNKPENLVGVLDGSNVVKYSWVNPDFNVCYNNIILSTVYGTTTDEITLEAGTTEYSYSFTQLDTREDIVCSLKYSTDGADSDVATISVEVPGYNEPVMDELIVSTSYIAGDDFYVVNHNSPRLRDPEGTQLEAGYVFELFVAGVSKGSWDYADTPVSKVDVTDISEEVLLKLVVTSDLLPDGPLTVEDSVMSPVYEDKPLEDPSFLKIEYLDATEELDLSWKRMSGASAYNVEIFVDGASWKTKVYEGVDSIHQKESLPKTTTEQSVYFTLWASPLAGWSASSLGTSNTVNVGSVDQLSKPTSLKISQNIYNITCDWDADSRATSHEIKTYVDGVLSETAVTAISYFIANPEPTTTNTTFKFTVVSKSSDGSIVDSDMAEIEKTIDPIVARFDKPTNLTLTYSSGVAKATWDAVDGAVHYGFSFYKNGAAIPPDGDTTNTTESKTIATVSGDKIKFSVWCKAEGDYESSLITQKEITV